MRVTRVLDFKEWLATRDEARLRAEEVEAAFADPYRRERPRDPDEARFLREQGTPEHLIGPERRQRG